jgi:uncharacterized membrane protein YbhN (UPF0104 family)
MTVVFIIPYFVYKSFHFVGANPLHIISAQAFTIMSTSFFPIPGATGANEIASMTFLGGFFTELTIKPAVLLLRIISYYLTIIISAPFAYTIKNVPKRKI